MDSPSIAWGWVRHLCCYFCLLSRQTNGPDPSFDQWELRLHLTLHRLLYPWLFSTVFVTAHYIKSNLTVIWLGYFWNSLPFNQIMSLGIKSFIYSYILVKFSYLWTMDLYFSNLLATQWTLIKQRAPRLDKLFYSQLSKHRGHHLPCRWNNLGLLWSRYGSVFILSLA